MNTAWEHAPTQHADLSAPATQLVPDSEAYLGQGSPDIGRRISDDQVELFIDGDVATALQHAFTQQAPDFVALHDVGASASLRLLHTLADAGGGRVQRLSVRRKGQGVALAVLQFVEMPLSDGRAVRAYSTDVNADGHSRSQLGRLLLAFSRLGALLVGELPPHALATQLAALHTAVLGGPWPNRELLLVPMGSGTALAVQAAQLAAGSPVQVHVAPHAGQPQQAWQYIGGAWNRMHGRRTGDGALPTELALAVPRAPLPDSEAPTLVMGLGPPETRAAARTRPAFQATTAMPAATKVATSTAAATAAAGAPAASRPGPLRWQAYAERCMLLKGSVACCVFDVRAMQPLAVAGNGAGPKPLRLAQQGTALLEHANDMGAALGMGAEGAEASVSTATHHALVRRVPGHAGVAVHVLLLASEGNVTLARMQLERITPAA